MFVSSKYSNYALRYGLALVFLYFGIDKFRHPDYWLNAWVPPNLLSLLAGWGVSGLRFVFINAVFETLVGLSMLLGVFTKFFAVLAMLFLLVFLAVSGLGEVTVRDVGLIGGFLAVLFWPPERSRF